jgi:hypothetical protein
MIGRYGSQSSNQIYCSSRYENDKNIFFKIAKDDIDGHGV